MQETLILIVIISQFAAKLKIKIKIKIKIKKVQRLDKENSIHEHPAILLF